MPRFNIFPSDPSVLSGIKLLRDFLGVKLLKRFLSDTARPSGDVNNAIMEMLNEHFIIPASLETTVKMVPVWREYSTQLDEWLRKFIEEYDLDIDVNVLDSKYYRARVALQFLLVLIKDVIENHVGEYPRSTVDEFLMPTIAGLNLVGLVRNYPVMLQFNGDVKVLGLISADEVKALKLVRIPLIAAGAIGEITLGQKRLMITTGTGKHFLDAVLLALSNSLNRAYYEYIINALIAVNYANRMFIEYYMPKIMGMDMYSVARGMTDEYVKIASRNINWNTLGKYIMYTIHGAVRDIAALVLALINQYNEAISLGAGTDLVNKVRQYLPTSDMKEIVRRMFMYSGILP